MKRFMIMFFIILAISQLVKSNQTQASSGIADNFDLGNEIGMYVYPNPCSEDYFVVGLRGGPSGIKSGTVTVYNLLGQEMIHEYTDAFPIRIKKLDWGKGVYVVKVMVQEQSFFTRIVLP